MTLGATGQGMVAGDLVNTARGCSRWPRRAPSSSARRPSGPLGGHRLRAGRRAGLKGKTAPVPAWRALRVVAERGGRRRAEALEAPFVGRDDELRLLKDLFHATSREQRARLVSVTGPGRDRQEPPGLGVPEVHRRPGRGDLVARGPLPAYGDGVTFWALGEMVRGGPASPRPTTSAPPGSGRRDGRRARAGRGGAPLGRAGPARAPRPRADRRRAPRSSSRAWRTFFERMAATGPVVMVFEDLQWADPGLLDFVDHLLEWSRGVPIYVLALARPELLERRPGLGHGQAELRGLPLEPLSRAGHARAAAGLVPGSPEAAVRRSSSGPAASPSTPSRPFACWSRRQLVARRRLPAHRRPRLAGRAGDAPRPHRVPARCSRTGRPLPAPGCGRPRPELHPRRSSPP